MPIKMRVNSNKESRCQECNVLWKNTPEMYDMLIVDTKFTLCKTCLDDLFRKTLKISCMYNGKLKSQEDLRRIYNSRKILNPEKEVKVEEVRPNCYGDFVKKKKCKECKYLTECRDLFDEKQWEDVE